MTKTHSLVLAAIALAVMFMPMNVENLVKPKSPLAMQISSIVGNKNTEKLAQLGASVEAASNLFASPNGALYNDAQKLKWAVKRVNELSYPEGWAIENEYPGLSAMLANWLETQLGEDFTKDQAAAKLRELGMALKEAS